MQLLNKFQDKEENQKSAFVLQIFLHNANTTYDKKQSLHDIDTSNVINDKTYFEDTVKLRSFASAVSHCLYYQMENTM